MKKILMIFDGQHFSESAFDFVCRLNELGTVLLTGVFLPSVDYTNTIIYYLGYQGPMYIPTMDVEEDMINTNIARFKTLCEKNNIEYRVHDKIEGSIIEGIKKETRYSDLLIISNQLFYSNLGKYTQHQYLHDTTHNSECPVLLLPEEYVFPVSIVLAFDGSESSVFAIKQFAYLFPELSSQETILVYASEKDNKYPDFDYIKEFAARHFPALSFLKLNTDPDFYFDNWLKKVAPAMLVTGAHGRSMMSELFKKSFVRNIINDHNMPVFISHK